MNPILFILAASLSIAQIIVIVFMVIDYDNFEAKTRRKEAAFWLQQIEQLDYDIVWFQGRTPATLESYAERMNWPEGEVERLRKNDE